MNKRNMLIVLIIVILVIGTPLLIFAYRYSIGIEIKTETNKSEDFYCNKFYVCYHNNLTYYDSNNSPFPDKDLSKGKIEIESLKPAIKFTSTDMANGNVKLSNADFEKRIHEEVFCKYSNNIEGKIQNDVANTERQLEFYQHYHKKTYTTDWWSFGSVEYECVVGNSLVYYTVYEYSVAAHYTINCKCMWV